jgi:hypothetical protein
MYPTLRRLPTTPNKLAARLHSMFDEPPIQAAAQLRAILSETLDIVETAYPQLDTSYPRYGLDQEPQALTDPLSV